MPGLDRYASMTGWNVIVTPGIRPYARCLMPGVSRLTFWISELDAYLVRGKRKLSPAQHDFGVLELHYSTAVLTGGLTNRQVQAATQNGKYQYAGL